MTPVLQLDNVVRRYHQESLRKTIDVLRAARLTIMSGEFVAVVGANGSGKSTLLETLAFLHPPEGGHVLLDGCDVWAEGKSLAARRQCPMLLQRTVLFKMSVLENVMFPLRTRSLSHREAKRRARDVLAQVGLEQLSRRRHNELSGGERQRVALARLLVLKPKVLVLDEPTAHVDREHAARIEDAIRQLHETRGATVVLASHDASQVRKLADRVLTLCDGYLLEGAGENLFRGSLHRRSSQYLFHGENGLVFSLDAANFPVGQWPDGRGHDDVHISLDPQKLRVEIRSGEGTESLDGVVQQARFEGQCCRVTVAMKTGHCLQVELSPDEYQQLRLNLGCRVTLRPSPGCVWCQPSQATPEDLPD
jgi:ABC-type methionine transport system ATPase subunit